MSRFSFGLVYIITLIAGCFPVTPEYDASVEAQKSIDFDNDGHPSDEDCNDLNADINPDADEICDGVDNNCDGIIDESTAVDASIWYLDADEDGFGDSTNTVNSCDSPSGYVANDADCDDADSSVYVEVDWYIDSDGDDFGIEGESIFQCNQPSGYADNDADCDDADSSVNPDADEICDDIDNNCDGDIDDVTAVDAITSYVDSDEDGFGDSTSSITGCEVPAGYVENGTDCDDADSSVNPDANEYCDGVDNNCDGDIDEGTAIDAIMWYLDADGDGFGADGLRKYSCDEPSGYIADNTDCDDADADINPSAVEDDEIYNMDCDSNPFTISEFETDLGYIVEIVGEASDFLIDEESAIFEDSSGTASLGDWYTASVSGKTDSDLGVAFSTFTSSDGTGVSGSYSSIDLLVGDLNIEDESANYVLDSGVTSAVRGLFCTVQSTASVDNELCLGINGIAQSDCLWMIADETGLRLVGYGNVVGSDVISIMSGTTQGGVSVTHCGLYEVYVTYL